MIITFKEISFRNFMSYGNNLTVFNLINPGTTLITGRNGDGKSTILNVIVYALYDKPAYDDIPKDGLINYYNKKDMEVNITFDIDSVEYKIKRERKSKNGNNVYLWINGIDKTLDSVSATNTKIEEILGIKYDLFVRIIVYCASQRAFLELSRTEQSNVFERLVRLTILSEKATKQKDRIKETEISLQLKQSNIRLLHDEHERHATQVANAQDRVNKWNVSAQSQISDLTDKLNVLSTIDFEKEKLLHHELLAYTKQYETDVTLLSEYTLNHKNIDALISKYNTLRHVDFAHEQQLHDQIQLIEKKLIENKINYNKYETIIKDCNIQLTEDNTELEHLKDNKCPYCLQQYSDANLKITELEQEIVTMNTWLSKATNSLNKTIKTNQQLERDKKELRSNLKTTGNIVQLMSEFEDIKTKIQNSEKEAEESARLIESTSQLKKDITTIKLKLSTTSIRELEQKKTEYDNIQNTLNILHNSTNPHLDALNELLNTKLEEINYNEINELDKVLTHQKFLLKLLTKKDSFVRRALLNRFIPYINSRLQHYLTELELPHKVTFTHEMAADITQFGRSLGFGNLSTGQKARVNIALSFAFSDILQKIHGTYNIFMLDEVLDFGLDSEGFELAVKLLKVRALENQLSMYIMSHRQEVIGVFDRTVTVYTDKQFSYIK